MPKTWYLILLQTALVINCYLFVNQCFSDSSVSYNPQLVEIYFDTATFDEIEKDRKVTLEAQLGVIGGTMGLLTGFSIISAVEIVYFFARLLMSSRHSKVTPNVVTVQSVSSTIW